MGQLLTRSELPDDFDHPPDFMRLVECGLLNLEPWHVLIDEASKGAPQREYRDRARVGCQLSRGGLGMGG